MRLFHRHLRRSFSTMCVPPSRPSFSSKVFNPLRPFTVSSSSSVSSSSFFSTTTTASPSSSSSVPSLPSLTHQNIPTIHQPSKHIQQRVMDAYHLFRKAYYPPSPDSSPFSTRTVPGISLWAETFYRRPTPHLLPGIFYELFRTPGMGIGNRSLSLAVFFSEIFRKMLKTENDVTEIMEYVYTVLYLFNWFDPPSGRWRSVHELPSPEDQLLFTEAFEKMDTILRGLYLAQLPVADTYLSSLSTQWINEFETAYPQYRNVTFEDIVKNEDKGKDDANDNIDKDEELIQYSNSIAIARSLFPTPASERHRLPLFQWPLPTNNLTLFESNLTTQTYPLYGCTRYWFMYCYSVRKLAQKNSLLYSSSSAATVPKASRIPLLSPLIAEELTKTMVDALWSSFYATGQTESVLRVLDIGTPYLDFIEEYGDEYILQYGQNAYMDPPTELQENDPYTRMRFETSRYALHTYLHHAQYHTMIQEITNNEYRYITNTVNLQDPFGTEGYLTRNGQKRLDILKYILPAVHLLHDQGAQKYGIGSGYYPSSFRYLDGEENYDMEHTRKQLSDGNDYTTVSHHNVPSTPIGMHATEPYGPFAPSEFASIAKEGVRDRRQRRK